MFEFVNKAWNEAKSRTRGQGMIKTILSDKSNLLEVNVAIIMAVVMGMATSKVIENIPVDNDILNVVGTAQSMGPTIDSNWISNLKWNYLHILGHFSPRYTAFSWTWGESWTNPILPGCIIPP